jgi:hypothetical protein
MSRTKPTSASTGGPDKRGRSRTSNVGAEFRNLGRRSVGLRIRVIVVRPPEALHRAADLTMEYINKRLSTETLTPPAQSAALAEHAWRAACRSWEWTLRFTRRGRMS